MCTCDITDECFCEVTPKKTSFTKKKMSTYKSESSLPLTKKTLYIIRTKTGFIRIQTESKVDAIQKVKLYIEHYKRKSAEATDDTIYYEKILKELES